MKITKFIIPGFLVWSIQLMFSDLLAIDTVRPDFCVILVLYWSIMYGRMVGTVTGFLMGLIIDLSGTGIFFGVSPLVYSITGYLGGNLNGAYIKTVSYTHLTLPTICSV